MKNFLLLGLLLFGIYAPAEESITVYKEGSDFFVRSKYSETEDLVIHTWRYANKKAYLIKRGAPLAAYKKGKVIHVSSDDYPAVAPLRKFQPQASHFPTTQNTVIWFLNLTKNKVS